MYMLILASHLYKSRGRDSRLTNELFARGSNIFGSVNACSYSAMTAAHRDLLRSSVFWHSVACSLGSSLSVSADLPYEQTDNWYWTTCLDRGTVVNYVIFCRPNMLMRIIWLGVWMVSKELLLTWRTLVCGNPCLSNCKHTRQLLRYLVCWFVTPKCYDSLCVCVCFILSFVCICQLLS